MFITFLTDFGLEDDFVGTCHGVIKRIAPDAQIIDITHGIRPGRILQGALALANALPYMPAGVHLAIVDPGVGGSRRPLALRDAEGRLYVGPDNGLLLPAADRFGGVAEAHELANPAYALDSVSRTFHGRDLFSPAAAHLALGVPLGELGPPIDPDALVRLELPEPEIGQSRISATVLAVDRFGNVALNLTRDHLDEAGDRPRHAGRARRPREPLLRRRGADVRRRDAGRADPLRGQLPERRRRRHPRQRRLAARRRGGQRARRSPSTRSERFSSLPGKGVRDTVTPVRTPEAPEDAQASSGASLCGGVRQPPPSARSSSGDPGAAARGSRA